MYRSAHAMVATASCGKEDMAPALSPRGWRDTAKFVEHIEDHCHVIVFPADERFHRGGKRESSSVGVQVERTDSSPEHVPFAGPQPRLLGMEYITLDGVGRHHDLMVWRAIEEFMLPPRPGWKSTTTVRDLPLAAGPREWAHVHFN